MGKFISGLFLLAGMAFLMVGCVTPTEYNAEQNIAKILKEVTEIKDLLQDKKVKGLDRTTSVVKNDGDLVQQLVGAMEARERKAAEAARATMVKDLLKALGEEKAAEPSKKPVQTPPLEVKKD